MENEASRPDSAIHEVDRSDCEVLSMREEEITHNTVKQLEGCKSSIEKRLQSNEGDWHFTGENPRSVLISGDYPTLYHFIYAKLERSEDFSRLPTADKRSYVIAMISLARAINSGTNLDDFASYKGKTIILPTKLQITPEFKKVLLQGSEGTRRLEELAEYDGFNISDPKAQERIYEESIAKTVPIPANPHYGRKENNGDSPNRLFPEAIERLTEVAKEFSALEFGGVKGWGLVYTDTLRDLGLQDKTYRAKGIPTYKSTAHTTGHAIDWSIGRVRHPILGEVTYSDLSNPNHPVPSKEWAPIIEEMWPQMERIALEHGFVVYREGDHLHLYSPKKRELENLFEEDLFNDVIAQTSGVESKGGS